MNIFINLFFIFIFLLTIFTFKFPNINDDNYISHKILIFFLLLVYQFLLEIISKIRNHCKINIKDIVRNSLNVSLFGVIGYSIFIDFKYMSSTEEIVKNINNNYANIYLTLLIVSIIALSKFIKVIFTNNSNDCIKYNYKCK